MPGRSLSPVAPTCKTLFIMTKPNPVAQTPSPATTQSVNPSSGQGLPNAATSSHPWHAHPAADALARLDSNDLGLTGSEATQRLAQYGPNQLSMAEGPSLAQRIWAQINNVLILVLLAAAAITALIDHMLDAGVILAVVVLNVTIGLLQEGKAEKALQAIRKLLAPHAVVWRDGRQQDIAAADLVPGDIVLVASGDSIPADLRFLRVTNLQVDESALTGESVPVVKNEAEVAVDSPLGDRFCMGFAGTLVTQGQAKGIVVGTAAQTEMGRIGRLLETVETNETPLVHDMAVLSKWLTGAILAIAGLLFVYGVWLMGMPGADMFLAAVGLAVAAIPEGLPAIMTITLAIGVQRMAARRAVVRRLPAVETLGAVTVICSDKTGTLTRNEMTVQSVILGDAQFEITGVGYAPEGQIRVDARAVDENHSLVLKTLVHAAALCNDAGLLQDKHGQWQLAGDPTEGALITLAMKAGISHEELLARRPRCAAIPFESDFRYMATAHPLTRTDGATTVNPQACEILLKGAPERILDMCIDQLQSDGECALLDTGFWQEAIAREARAGRRVLAFAKCTMDHIPDQLERSHVTQGLTLVGLVGIIDPPRTEAITAVAQCQAAGIAVKMITGDHALTATAIAGQLGLSVAKPALTGPEIEALPDLQLQEVVKDTAVFARASPEHKLRLVRAMQANGEVVAMTGDGVNDAPALKQADVGVAMGQKGTEAAKQAGEIVLADDNFASIAHAVEEGRTVYDNLRKVITFLLPINGGESMAIGAAILLGLALPIMPAQILWVNMVSSVGLALVLAFEPTEAGVMQRPPRNRNAPMLSPFLLWRIGLVSTLFVGGVFSLYYISLAQGASIEEARTVAVNTLVAMEIFYLFSVRYLKSPSFTMQGVKGTPKVLMAIAFVVTAQLVFTYAPLMQKWFGTAPLSLWQLAEAAIAGVVVLLVLEIEKTLLRRFHLQENQ
jgi:magnesium-transporting ATPase (P-type)